MKANRLNLRTSRKHKKQPAFESRKPVCSRILAGSAALLAASVMLATTVAPARGASLIWDVLTGDGAAVQDGNLGFTTNQYQIWANGIGNWNTGAGDTTWNNATPDDAIFGGGTSGIARTVALGSAVTAGSLTFNTPNSGTYTIFTDTYSLTLNTGIIANESATIRSGLGGSVLLGGNNDWNVAAGKTLTVLSDIDDGGNFWSLTKSGAGNLVLGGMATYLGDTFINAGILRAGSADALGTVGVITFGGGTLQYTADSATGTDYSPVIKNSAASIKLDTNGQNVEMFGIIDSTNTGGLTKLGTGTLVLSGANSFSGDINVAEGLVVSTGNISGGGGLSKTGDGTLVLRGTSSYTGVTTISGGMILDVPFANDGAVLGAIGAGNETVVTAGGTLAFGPDANGSGAIGNPAEIVTISGNGFRNNGALRNLMGANGTTVNGAVTLADDARIQADLTGTFTLSGAFSMGATPGYTLRAGGIGFVSLSGVVTGTGNIVHYGLSGFRITNTASTVSGTILSELGELRAEGSSVTTGVNGYENISSITIKNGLLQMLATQTTGGAAFQNQVDDDIPIFLSAGRIRLENNAFNNTNTTVWNEVVGPVTLTSGDALIDLRDTTSGAAHTITLTSFARNAGTTLRMSGDGGAANGIGAGAQYRILNSAIEGTGDVAFVGGWAYGFGSSTTQTEFLKYNDTTLGGFGYATLGNADYAIDTAEGTWAAGQNIKVTSGNRTITANRTVQSLNMAGTTARTLSGDPGTTLIVDAGGVITTGNTTHTISVPFLTAGAASSYELYLIGTNSSTIISDVTDNGLNKVSVVKTGGGTASFVTANSYTGTTFINEGQFRGVIGSKAVALGSGNLTFGGSAINQSTYENDGHFTRALGTGVGQVQFLGGTGSGFSAYGAPIDINFGGMGSAVTWGSATFNPGVFTLNGGNATHVATLVNALDLGGEQRYIRLDGSASGGNRAVMGIISGDITNGGIVKRGGGELIFNTPKSYEGGTIISEGEVWLSGTGTAGANVAGNDIQINQGGLLYIEGPGNIGSRQVVILQNISNDTPAALDLGPGYGTGLDALGNPTITFNSFTATGGIPNTGGNNFLIANNQSGQARRISVILGSNRNFQADIPGLIFAVAPNVEVWFGADNGGAVFTGTTLSPSGGAVQAYRFGGNSNNSAVFTIANADVLQGAFPLIIGAPDNTDRNYTDGTIYIPKAQPNFSGTVTIGSGGILQVGENAALGTGTADITIRSGELRLDVAGGNFGGSVGTQYAARNVSVIGGTGTIRTTTLGGGGFNTTQMGDLTFDANRTLQVFSIGNNFTDLAVNNINFANSANTISLLIGSDNVYTPDRGLVTVNGIIGDQATGAQTLQKMNGGMLILTADNTYDGNTIVQQGRLVLTHVGAAGSPASSLQFNTNSDRISDIDFRIDGAGPHTHRQCHDDYRHRWQCRSPRASSRSARRLRARRMSPSSCPISRSRMPGVTRSEARAAARCFSTVRTATGSKSPEPYAHELHQPAHPRSAHDHHRPDHRRRHDRPREA